MKKILCVTAFVAAALMTLLLLATFMMNDSLARASLRLPFMKLDPVYSGGAIADTLSADEYRIYVHEPVFSALFGQSREGYVQIDVDGMSPQIEQNVDIDGDGDCDLTLCLDRSTGKVQVDFHKDGLWLERNTTTDHGWVVRISLCNPDKVSASCAGCPFHAAPKSVH